MAQVTDSPKCHYETKVMHVTSSNGNIFRVAGHMCWSSPVSGEFPAQRPVTRSFDVFFDLRLNKQLNKQSWDWWLKTLSRSLWWHCNENDSAPVRCVLFCEFLQTFSRSILNLGFNWSRKSWLSVMSMKWYYCCYVVINTSAYIFKIRSKK